MCWQGRGVGTWGWLVLAGEGSTGVGKVYEVCAKSLKKDSRVPSLKGSGVEERGVYTL